MRFHHTVLSSDTAATLCRAPLTWYVGLLSSAWENAGDLATGVTNERTVLRMPR